MTDERDNRERLSKEQAEDDNDVESTDQTPGADPLQFVSPTQIIDLPSRGRFYPPDNPLKGVDSVEIGSMTAHEEDMLNNEDLVKRGQALDRVLDSLLENAQYSANDFLVGDKDALLIHARVDAYTSRYDVTLSCPICAEHSEKEYDILEEAEVSYGGLESMEDEKIEEFSVQQEDDHLFSMKLPECSSNAPEGENVRVTFSFMRGKQAQELAEQKRNLEKRNMNFSDNIEQMKKYVESVNGHTSLRTIRDFLQKMPARDARALRNVYQELKPSYDMITEFECPSCRYHEQREVPIRGTFFWPDRKS